MINIYNIDCLEAMQDMKDNQYDLAIVDPPYGMLESGMQMGGHVKGKKFNRNELIKWDSKPKKEYFIELLRVSKNQIIWGGNYFNLPPTRCVICWDKKQPWINYSQIEIAWTSYNTPARLFNYDNRYAGKIHPTQKPVQLYKWILQNYAKEGDTILDTHLGSGSIAVACHDMDYDLDAYELDTDYFNSACKRLKEHQRQLKLPIF